MRSIFAMSLLLLAGTAMVPMAVQAQEGPDDCFTCQWNGDQGQYACVQVEPGPPGQTDVWEECETVFGHCEVQGEGCGTLDLTSALGTSPTGDRSDIEPGAFRSFEVDVALAGTAGPALGASPETARRLVTCDGTVVGRQYAASVDEELRKQAELLVM